MSKVCTDSQSEIRVSYSTDASQFNDLSWPDSSTQNWKRR